MVGVSRAVISVIYSVLAAKGRMMRKIGVILLRKWRLCRGVEALNPNLDSISRVGVPIVVFVVVLTIGADIMEQQVSNIEDTKLEMCEEHFQGEFSSEKVKGELICVQDDEIYRPEVQLLSGVLHYLKVLWPVLGVMLAILAVKVVPPSRSSRISGGGRP